MWEETGDVLGTGGSIIMDYGLSKTKNLMMDLFLTYKKLLEFSTCELFDVFISCLDSIH